MALLPAYVHVFLFHLLVHILQGSFARAEIFLLISFGNYISFNFTLVILQGGALVWIWRIHLGWGRQLQRRRRLALEWFPHWFSLCLVWIAITLSVSFLDAQDTCMVDLSSSTFPLSMGLGQFKVSFYTWIFCWQYRLQTLWRRFSEMLQLCLCSALEKKKLHLHWKQISVIASENLHISMAAWQGWEWFWWSLFKIRFYPFPLSISIYTWPLFLAESISLEAVLKITLSPHHCQHCHHMRERARFALWPLKFSQTTLSLLLEDA